MLGTLAVVVLTWLVGRRTNIELSNGEIVRITSESVWSSKESCNIIYRPRNGKVGTVILLESSVFRLDVAQPAFIAPSADNNCLLVLYDADVRYRLLKIDPTKPFSKFPDNSYLNYIVQSSPWHIEEGTSNDWAEVHSYLKNAPQAAINRQALTTIDLGIVWFHYRRKDLISDVERQIYNLEYVRTY